VGYLRSSLHYLYDPVHLRRSRWSACWGLGEEFDRGAALQRHLTSAIHDLKPVDDEPSQSAAWRIHDTLSLLYIRQFCPGCGGDATGYQRPPTAPRTAPGPGSPGAASVAESRSYLPGRNGRATGADCAVDQENDRALSDELAWLQSTNQEQHAPWVKYCRRCTAWRSRWRSNGRFRCASIWRVIWPTCPCHKWRRVIFYSPSSAWPYPGEPGRGSHLGRCARACSSSSASPAVEKRGSGRL